MFFVNYVADLGERVYGLFGVKLFSVQGVEVTMGGVVALIMAVAVSTLLGRLASRALVRTLKRGPAHTNEGTSYALGRMLQYGITAVGILIGLENVGISITTLAALGAVLAVGLGFGLQNITQNFISGLILLLERPIKKGDVVNVGGQLGIVDEISIRATRIMTFDDVALIVPNSKFISDTVENRSEPSTTFRIRIDVGVAYGTDTEMVSRTLLQVAKGCDRVLTSPEPVVFFLAFGDSSLDFQLCCWIADPVGGYSVGTQVRHAIAKAFQAEGITIPFPQRDVHLFQRKTG